MPSTLSVGLLSGETVSLEVSPKRFSVGDVRVLAEDRLQKSLSVLVDASGAPLNDRDKICDSGLQHGDQVSALVRPPEPRVFSGPFAYAFAAVLPEGRVVAWGDQARGGSLQEVEGLEEVVCLEASAGAFCALKADGSLRAWGGAAFGGDLRAVPPERLVGVRLLKASALGFSAATEGDIVVWGSAAALAPPANFSAVELVSSTDAFAARDAGGRVCAWGNAEYGGDCSEVQGRLVDVKSLCASDGAFAALTWGGQVVTWGNSSFGGDGPALEEVVALSACGRGFAAQLRNGVVCWGDPQQGGDNSQVRDQLQRVRQVVGSAGAFAAVTEEGRVVTWGSTAFGGECSAVRHQLVEVDRVVASRRAFAALRKDGGVVTWGFPMLGGDSQSVQAQLHGVTSLVASSGAFCALRSGRLVCWGGLSSGGGGPGDLEEDEAKDVEMTVPTISVSSA